MATKTFELLFMDGYDEVIDANTYETVFDTKRIRDKSVVDNVIVLWNEKKNIADNLFSGGVVDDYLLDEGACTTEEKEYIVESIYSYALKNNLHISE